MAQDVTLSIETRERTGTTSAHSLRAQGKVPGVLYGHGTAPAHIAVDAHAFENLLHHGGRNALIQLTTNGKKGDTALLRDMQRDPVSRKVIHVDLQRVSADESVQTSLPVVTVGVAVGVKDFSGVMDVIVHELEIEGPANRIPEHIEIDVTSLGLHQHVSAGDVQLPSGFKMITPADPIVVAIESSKTERSLEEAAAGPGEQATPEVIGAKPESEGA